MTFKTFLYRMAALLTLAVAVATRPCPAYAQGFISTTAPTNQQTLIGRTVWHHVGRVFVNPTTGQFVYVGYLVNIDAINGSLFNGTPSESTAYFTFSTDVAQLIPLPNNNDVALDLVSAGTFNVYYNANPGADWSNPASFSSGRLIATFNRKESLFALLPSASFHSLSETLQSSSSFKFDGQFYNFNRIAPNGITFAQFFSTTPQGGTSDFPATFSGAGSVVAVGAPHQARPPWLIKEE